MTTPETSSRAKSGLIGWIAVVLSLSLLSFISWSIALRPDPESVVRGYLEAILDRDVDSALEHTHARIADGVDVDDRTTLLGAYSEVSVQEFDTARTGLLHPDAISTDWEVLEVREVDSFSLAEDSVEAVIGHDSGTATFVFYLNEFKGRYAITNGLAVVRLAPGPNLFVETGDHLVEFDIAEHPQVLAMFPGVYEFTTPQGSTGPVAVDPGVSDPIQTAPDLVTDEQVAAAEEELRALIDECASTTETEYHPCPFGTGGMFETDELEFYAYGDDVRWTVEEYPTFELDFVMAHGTWILKPVFTDPGRITLGGLDTVDQERVWVTVGCEFYDSDLYVYFHADGTAEVRWGRGDTDEDDERMPWVSEETCGDIESVTPADP